MAEGGLPQWSFKDSFSKASDDAEEVFCDPCSKMHKWGTVDGYCQTCQEYLCRHCLNVHKNLRITRGHTILDKKEMPRGQRPNTKHDHRVEVSKTHHPEKAKFYYNNQNEPGFRDSMTLNHASCKKEMVQDMSDGFQATNESELIKQELDEFHDKLKVMKHELDNNLKHLVTTFDNIQHKITSFRKYVNDYLDQIQKQITDEAAEIKRTYKTKMKNLIAKNESMNSKLEAILQKKQSKQILGKMKHKINEIEQSQQQVLQQIQHYVFRPSIEIEELVSANPPLGKLLRKPNVNTRASHRGTITVKSKCRINDCTLLEPDRMVVTDEENKNIKLIDLSNEAVITSNKTSVPPWGVTAVRTDQVAVSLPEGSKVQLLNVASTFTKQHKIQVNKGCYGIAYKDGKFAVAYRDPDRVEILDKEGQVLHTIQGKEKQLQYPGFITFGQDNDTVIVAAGREVSVVSFKGHILHTYTDNECVSGIASTPDGVLFVCSQNSKRIYAVSPDFKTSKTIINTEGYPNSISYCDINHRLYITNRYSGGSEIKVYDLNV